MLQTRSLARRAGGAGFNRSRLSAAALAVVGVLALGASSVLAGGPPVVNTTDHFVEAGTSDGEHFCTGQPAQVSVVETGVIHFAAFADGTVHFTGTLHGVVSADLLPADGIPDATSR